MSAASYEIRLCLNPACGLRYPLIEAHPFGERCPACLGETQVALKRTLSTQPSSSRKNTCTGVKAALLDNIRSAWNVGSIFRTSEGLGIETLYLCGTTPTPENKSVRKTSLGAEDYVDWEYSLNALEMAKKLKREGQTLIALEQDTRAYNLTECQIQNSKSPIIILGNEVTGVDPEILDLCDQIVHIPMRGQKRSFNVEVAFAIAAYTLGQT
jgi:23S rRNA (guanosine2251-2'-O)-methyltransferase